MDIFLKKTSRDIVRKLDNAGINVVGWGTGSSFDRFFDILEYKPKYLADNDNSRHGIALNGLRVHSPQRVFEEDPNNTFVIIYSVFADEIGKQLEKNGFFNYESAYFIAGSGNFEAVEKKLSNIFSSPLKSSLRKTDGIVIQGPMVPECTEYVVRSYRHIFANARIVLSTWVNSDSELLAKCSSYVDDLVLSELPANRGLQNRNCQIVSTNAGLNKLSEYNLRYVMKTRTDVFLFNSDIFELVDSFKKYDTSACNKIGMRGRLFVMSTYTRKHLFYHPSDVVVIGAQEDMEKYWNVELDDRENLPIMYMSMKNAKKYAIDKYPAESYICQKFLEKNGVDLQFTLDDSNKIYRDYFCILDDEQLGFVWVKNLAGNKHDESSKVFHCFSHKEWLELLNNHK